MARHKPRVVAEYYRLGKGWQECPEHKAQAWAVRVGSLLIARFGRKLEAANECHRVRMAAAGPSRRYKLGARMPKQPTADTSLQLDEAFLRQL